MQEERGSIAVETAITLPIILLLTLGGLSVLWWLHNKLWMQVLVSETARERAAAGTLTAYVDDISDTLGGDAGKRWAVPNLRLLSVHLPTEPTLVMVAACNTPKGAVPEPPPLGDLPPPVHTAPDSWLNPIRDVREYLEEGLARVEAGIETVDGWAEKGLTATERLIWYRRVAGNLAGERAHQRQKAIEYLVGGLLEDGGDLACGQGKEQVITAKAVIRGERVFAQR